MHDELRHDHDRDRARIRRHGTNSSKERVAEVAEVRLVNLEGHVEVPLLPVTSEPLSLFCAEGEEDCAKLVERQRLRVADRAQRGSVYSRDGNQSDGAARDDRFGRVSRPTRRRRRRWRR